MYAYPIDYRNDPGIGLAVFRKVVLAILIYNRDDLVSAVCKSSKLAPTEADGTCQAIYML